MPLPQVQPKQSEQDFVSSCMGSKTMLKEFPDQKKRAAVCYSIYRQSKKRKKTKGDDLEPTWHEQETEKVVILD